MNALVAEVVARLEAAADPERAAFTAGYHPTAARLLGVPMPVCRGLGAELARRLRDAPAADVLALADALVGAGLHETRVVAGDLVAGHRPAREALDRPTVERLGRGLDNWASVDHFGAFVAGPAWLRGRLADADLAAWAASPDRWWRRLALVCTTVLNKKSAGGPGDAPRTLAVCAALAADPDPLVTKALSWALRALAAREPDAVRAFVDARPALPALVRREVRRALEAGRRPVA